MNTSSKTRSFELTRETVDFHLDAGHIQGLMRNGNWWTFRRNGATRRWARDASRIRIPVKGGLWATTQITESDFMSDGTINPEHWRLNMGED